MQSPSRHLGLGARVVLERPGLMALAAAVELTAGTLGLLPVAVGGILLLRRLAGAGEAFRWGPLGLGAAFADLTGYVGSAPFLLPLAGLTASGALIAGLLRVVVRTGMSGQVGQVLGGVGPGDFATSVVRRHPATFGVLGLEVVSGLALAGWAAGLGLGALLAAGRAGPAAGAAALAFAAVAPLALWIFRRAALGIAYVRATLFDEGPAVAVWEAARLVLRRPGSLLLLALLVVAVELGVALLLTGLLGLQGLLPDAAAVSAPAGAAGLVAILIRVAVLAGVGLVAWGAFTALVLDDAGRLPAAAAKPPPPPPPPAPARRVHRALPVARAVPVPAPAGPAGQGDDPTGP